ncbi:MAG: DEAD/DEAH box helicase [Actinomycetota bacterium]
MLEEFSARYPFPLDGFQLDAIVALDEGRSVLVAAPTGSGKTVVAEYAIHMALESGRKAFYTTPLKALSNQKFGDLVARYGVEQVGLLTGDNTINGEAPVVVMTTEVLRNMLYERSPTLGGLAFVVMDEVHYLQDPYRGAVWEEVLIHLPPSVDVVCLSATISNAEEFGEWIGTLRGPTEVVIEERRPVPLEHHYLVGHQLHPMHVDQEGRPAPNPYLVSLDQRELRVPSRGRRSSGQRGTIQSRRGRPREGHRRVYIPRREEVVEVLDDAGMLPAIYFIFSRAGCDRSVKMVLDAGVRLTTAPEARHIREFAELRAAWMDEEDLSTLGFEEFVEALAAGVASHHAGMLPLFKETVEELFEQGLVKVVFATETLSLGINMPAKTVVLEDLWKFQGERHEMLTPGEYTQLTGRAGRRSIDEVGHAVVVYQRDVGFERVAALASTRTYELRSSFRPSYNMAVNLVRNYTREQAHQLLDSSFGQFLADRSVVSVERGIARDRDRLAELHGRMACDRGDFLEYWQLREHARETRRTARKDGERVRTDAVKQRLARLRPGDVIFLPGTRRRGLAAVVSSRDGKPTAVTQDRRERPFRLLPNDFPEPPEPVTKITLPRSGRAHSPKYRRDVASALLALDVRAPRSGRSRPDHAAEEEARDLDLRADRHPCNTCPDRKEHERFGVQASKIAASIERAERRIRTKTETLGRRFDRVLAVLEELGYVKDFSILPKGEVLARIYGEGDILVGEAIDDGALLGLTAAETAAVVSTMVYESRERYPREGRMPSEASAEAARALSRTWKRIRRVEEEQQVELCRELDLGFAEPIHRWAAGDGLPGVLEEAGMTPGDFVRNCKQLLDLLRQIDEVAPDTTDAGAARNAVNRGVVAYTGV